MSATASPVEICVAAAATAELVAAFERLLPQLSSSAPAMSAFTLGTVIAEPSNTLFLARDPTAGGQIVGSLTLVMFRIPTALRAWIEDVVVDESVRGRGVGEAMVHAAVTRARERGAKTIDLTSRSSRQAAHRLYEKSGFHVRDTSVYRHGPKPAS
jgi:ribosomal protein S18 acetylase RimI-like enzyme